jgi:hypothetical protein
LVLFILLIGLGVIAYMYTPLGVTVRNLFGSVAGGTGSILDNTKPQISNIEVAAGETVARIDWITNEPASSQVEYGTSQESTSLYPVPPDQDPTSGTSAGVVTHSVTVTGLSPSTTASKIKYYYRVKSKDAAGNEAVSDWKSFETTVPEA